MIVKLSSGNIFVFEDSPKADGMRYKEAFIDKFFYKGRILFRAKQ